ncbi:MAG: winged helix-turn-helix transcriptional regulator [Rubrivivax sp.]|nr:winged helix-turn-helix transcriptional regulator [Rubrivivax sp.]
MTSIDSSLFFKLVRVVNLTARPFVETLSRAHHLSLNEWRVMVVLAGHPGVAATDIVEATGLDKMSVSRALAALQRRGRLTKQPDPADARRASLRLSADGQALFRRLGTSAARREAQLFGGVTAAELVQMSRTLDRLIAGLRASEPEQA